MPSFRLLASALLLLAPPLAHAQASINLGLRLGLNRASRSGSSPSYIPTTSNGAPVANVVQDYQRTALLAPQFGAVAEVRFGKLAVQPAVLFSQKGVDQHLTVTSQTTTSGSFPTTTTTSDEFHTISRPNYLEIPINVVFTFKGDHGFQLFAGPYVAFGLGGRDEYETNGTSSSAGPSGTNSSSYWNFSTGQMLYKDDFPGPPAYFLQNGINGTVAYPAPFAATSGYYVARRFDAGLNAGIGYRLGPLQVQLGYGFGLVNQQPGKALFHRDDLPAYYQRVAQLTASYFLKIN